MMDENGAKELWRDGGYGRETVSARPKSSHSLFKGYKFIVNLCLSFRSRYRTVWGYFWTGKRHIENTEVVVRFELLTKSSKLQLARTTKIRPCNTDDTEPPGGCLFKFSESKTRRRVNRVF